MVKRKASASQTETETKVAKQNHNPQEPDVTSGTLKKKFSKRDKPLQKKPNKFANKSNEENAKFKHFEKRDKPFNPKQRVINKVDEKTDWIEFKKKKKELRIKRKQNKSLFEIITKAKQIGESLRKKTLEGGKAERNRLVNELHEMLGGQGNYVKFVLSHDMARIVQYLLKFGNQQIREEIAAEISPSMVQMLQSKYGRYCIKRLFKYGNSKTRSNAIKAMYGNVVKLTSHSVSAHVFEYIYSTWTQPLEKVHLIQEFYGDLFKQSKDINIKHLRDVYKNSPDMKSAALGATKANLSRVLNKDLLDSGLIQSVLYQYLSECSENDRTELITQLAPHAVVLSNSKDGSRAVMELIWHGTTKDKKVIMKALKENILELSKHEHAHTVLIALLDGIDDTVLLNKIIISEIVKNAHEIAIDEWGRKVILWLVAPADSAYFHPVFTTELDKGRQKSSSKKSPEARRKEILSYSCDILLENIKDNTRSWLGSASLSVVALAILKAGSGEPLSTTLLSIAEVVTDTDWKIRVNDEDISGIEHTGLHMSLKKLIQNDKNAEKDEKPTFCEALLQHLNDDVIKSWVKMNRGCFLLVAMIENGKDDVVNVLREKLKERIKRIKKGNTAGSKILLKKVVQ